MSESQSPEIVHLGDLTPRQVALIASVEAVVKPRVEAAAVTFFDPDDDRFAASGTLVSYKGRVWIATAEHVVQGTPSKPGLGSRPRSRVAWAPPGPATNLVSEPVRAVVASAYASEREADVAALLLHRHERLVAHAWPIPATQLFAATTPVDNDDLVFLVGAPVAARDVARLKSGLANSEVLMWLATHVKNDCMSFEHQDHEMQSPRDPKRDFHVDWSRASALGGEYEDLFGAGGMSGAALWSAEVRNGEAGLWSASTLRVLGIAWYHDPSRQCVRAVPAGEWLRCADALLENELRPWS